MSPISSGQLLLGCLWGQHPIKKCEANSFCQKWQTEIPEGFACPIPSINGADFVGRERVISGNPANRFGSGFGSSTKLLHEVINPISVPNGYLNTVFDDVVSLCGSCRKNALPWSPQENLKTCCNSLRVCKKVFLASKGCPIK